MLQTAWYSRVRALLSGKSKSGKSKSGKFVSEIPEAVVRLVVRLSVAALFLLQSQNVYAIDLQTALTNLSNVIIPLTGLVLMSSYVAGVFMIFQGIMLMKKMGGIGSSTTAQPGELGGPLVKIIVGAILIYLPTSTDAFMNSIFATGATIFSSGGTTTLQDYQGLSGPGASLLGYVSGDVMSQTWQSLANTLVLYIQFIGLLSFVKGWFIMSHATGQGSQPGNFAKGLTHIIGGIIAINFVGMVNLLSNTINGTG